MELLTCSHPHGLDVDYRIRMGRSHRFRHRIDSVPNRSTATVVTYEIPSRGFRRHLRRQKQQARTAR